MSRSLSALAVATALAATAPAAARAQTLTVTAPAAPPGGAAPLVNGVVMGVSSPVYLDVANGRAGTVLTQITFQASGNASVIAGGAGPPGWTVSNVSTGGARDQITFQVVTCGQAGIASGQTGRFRIDYQRPVTSADTTTGFKSITPSDPCTGTGGWSVGYPSIQEASLSIAATAAPASGASPLSTTVTYTVTNQSTTSRTVSMALPTVTPSAGATPSACTPASLAIAANGGSGSFTCPVVLAPGATPTVYTIASNASGGTAASGLGAAVTVVAGPVASRFAFDLTDAANGDVVRATLQVTNATGAAIAVAPPAYAALTLTSLAPVAGVGDPAAVPALAPGATASFTYVLSVTGPPGASYVAAGAAATGAGATNVATTPAGVVSAWSASWTPPVVVTSRHAPPYPFAVSVTNGSAGNVSQIDLVNPQNGTFTGMANVSATGLTCAAPASSGATTTISCTGTLAQSQTATMNVSFAGLSAAGTYPFQVVVYGTGGHPMQTITRSVTVRTAVDFDVASVTIGSTSAGQTLQWVNTSTATGTHDGVVIFRTAAPAVPQSPSDYVQYAAGTGQVVYADRYASPVDTFVDPTPGAYNYRVCNHDAAFVYSNCSSGFWNGAGWLDSAAAPAGGWTHQTGTGVYLAPGVIPGAALLGVATNVPSVLALGTASGARSADPVALAGTPSSAAPAVPLGNGLEALFAADSAGGVTAVDLASGAVAWTAPQPGESFVGGVTGALASMLPAGYGSDLLFLASTTGDVLAVDARTGQLVWTVSAGSPVRALPTYDFDASSWRLYVATDGGGIVAYDLAGSSPGVAPLALASWSNPGGAYTLGCIPFPYGGATSLACADRNGVVSLVDRLSGAVAATVATGLSTPTSIWQAGSALLVSNAAQVIRLDASGTAPAVALAQTAGYAPGLTLSPIQVFVADGFVYVGGSDLRIHKLALATLAELSTSMLLRTQAPGVVLGPPAYDVVNDRVVVGTSDGRIWALPKF